MPHLDRDGGEVTSESSAEDRDSSAAHHTALRGLHEIDRQGIRDV